MKIKVLVSVFLVLVGAGYAVNPSIDDGRVKEILERRFQMLHPSRNGISRLLSDLNYASNRLVSVAKEVCFDPHTDRWQKIGAMNIVSEYGVPEDVGFLISCATNRDCWYSAAVGIVHLLGPTTNAINEIDALMRCTFGTNDVDHLESDRAGVMVALLNLAAKPDVSAQEKMSAWNYSMSFSSNHVRTVMVLDSALSRFDVSFPRSKRRLEWLRYLQPLETSVDLRNYVSDEIRKLESFGEVDLFD